MLTMVTSYGLPMINGHEEQMGYAPEVITKAAWVVIAFQGSILLAYNWISAHPKVTPFWTEELLKNESRRYISYGVVLNTVYLAVSNYSTVIPPNWDGVIRALCAGIASVCIFIAFQSWGAGELPKGERTFIAINLVAQFILQSETLFLIGVISLAALASLGYITSNKRVPPLPIILIVSLTAILHNGEASMRAKYWYDDGTRIIPSLSDLPSFYATWISNGLSPSSEAEQKDKGAAANLIQRTSLFQMVCLVVTNSPDRVPFVTGATYADIPVQLIPRFFWPNKPSGQWSTNYLSIYYGLQSEEGTYTTTIAFGQVAEAYANFGFFTVVLVGFATGAFYKCVQNWTKYTPILSGAGLLVVVLMGWTFQSEYTLSTWISSFYQSCVAILVALTAFRTFFP